ncbi:MAG: hypothetical protein K8R16_00175 [Anaerolineales bacterium]|nr:hypothetical protein [Anaerolineales bacterium]
MNGIAISVYDKFEEVGVLIDIIRKNWKNDYYISLCSNYPNAKRYIEDFDVDCFTQGVEIKYSPEMPWIQRGRTNLVCRVLDTIKKSCTGAMVDSCEYVMHLHSDAWPLGENSFLKISQELKEKKKKIAVRGLGFLYYGQDVPLGHIDDMFFIFDVNYFYKIDFFGYNPIELFPHKNSVHGALVLQLLGKIGIKNIYYYSHHSNLEYWDGKNKILPFERVKPSVFDPYWKFLHVHTSAFPDNLGKSVQAYYLKKYEMTKGDNIQKFIQKYYQPEAKLFNTLSNIEQKQNLKLKLMGFNPVVFGRNFSLKEEILTAPLKDKVKMLVMNLAKAPYYRLLGKKDIRTRNLYPDSLWPNKNIYEYYNEIIHFDDFPEEYRDFWFSENSK